MRAISFILETCFNIFLSIYIIRAILQIVRGNFKNPITQIITRLTNPLIMPLRKILPPMGKLDSASLLSCVLISIVMSIALLLIKGIEFNQLLAHPGPLIIEVLRNLLLCILQLYWILILLSIVLSWIQPNQHSPLSAVIQEITEPILSPVRRLIKPIGGLDISPIPVLIFLSALQYQFTA